MIGNFCLLSIFDCGWNCSASSRWKTASIQPLFAVLWRLACARSIIGLFGVIHGFRCQTRLVIQISAMQFFPGYLSAVTTTKSVPSDIGIKEIFLILPRADIAAHRRAESMPAKACHHQSAPAPVTLSQPSFAAPLHNRRCTDGHRFLCGRILYETAEVSIPICRFSSAC